MKDIISKEIVDTVLYSGEVFQHTLHKCAKPCHKIVLPVGLADESNRNDLPTFPMLGGYDNHACLVGMPGSGVTNTLLSLLGSLCILYSPDELQILYADCESTNGNSLYVNARTAPDAYAVAHEYEALLPNMAKLVQCDSSARRIAFLDEMRELLNVRVEWLRDNKMLSFVDGKGLPRVLVVMDNALPMLEIDTAGTQVLINLLQLGWTAGMHFLFTGDEVSARSLDNNALYKDYITLHLCMRLTTMSASALACTMASNIKCPGVCVTTSTAQAASQRIYRVPLVQDTALYEKFHEYKDRYACKASVRDKMYLRKVAYA